MSIYLHPGAETELRNVAAWYDQRRAGLASGFLAHLAVALNLIESDPERWPPWPGLQADPPIRRFVLTRFPYVVPYLVRDDLIVVLAIAHVRRQPTYWRNRTENQAEGSETES